MEGGPGSEGKSLLEEYVQDTSDHDATLIL